MLLGHVLYSHIDVLWVVSLICIGLVIAVTWQFRDDGRMEKMGKMSDDRG